jgi:hypothetical protein
MNRREVLTKLGLSALLAPLAALPAIAVDEPKPEVGEWHFDSGPHCPECRRTFITERDNDGVTFFTHDSEHYDYATEQMVPYSCKNAGKTFRYPILKCEEYRVC